MLNKRKLYLIFTAIIIPCLVLSNNNLGDVIAQSDEKSNEIICTPDMLGMLGTTFDTHVGLNSMDYLNGKIYGVALGGTGLYGFDAVTGVSTDNISLSFPTFGITTDGIDLYLSIYSAGKNGSIVKMDTTGTEISRIHVDVDNEYIGGLTWDGTYLWGYQTSIWHLLKIDPANGNVLSNFTIGRDLRDLSWFDTKIWGVAWGLDRVDVINPYTGSYVEGLRSPYHHDSGITNNGTHMFQSDYATELEVDITPLNTNPGEVFLREPLSSSSILDVALAGNAYYFTENYSTTLTKHSSQLNSYDTTVIIGFQAAGITNLDDSTLLISEANAPYNLLTVSTTGTILANQTALGVMLVSLAFDGTNIWAMGQDSILYKLDPFDMSIISQYPLEYFRGITYDSISNIIWAVSRVDHQIKYFDPVKEELGNAVINLTAPVAPLETGLTFTGDYLISTAYYAGNSYFYKINPVAKDIEPEPTPTPTPTPTPSNSTGPDGLFPGLPYYVEDLIFLGIGLVTASIIAIVIAIARRKRA
ncbi:MAG: hypothetical protein FK733_01355 [Asgard group archaeon]|nr:hypothetical protein [Asgard group archaeon]